MPVLSLPDVVTHHDGANHTCARRSSIGPRLREITLQYVPKRGVDGRAVHLSAGPRVMHSLAAAHVLARILAHEPAEVFGVLCLTARARVIGWHEVSRGILNRVRVHAREVFQAAMLANAAFLILGHNHPSGEAEPSLADLHLTRRLIKTGALVGVDILDHIITGDREFASIRPVTPFGDTEGPYEGHRDVLGRTCLSGGLVWTKALFHDRN